MTDEQVVNFVEWIMEKLQPEYDMDTRPRFTLQIVLKDEPFVWIETHNFSRSEPKFNTTQEILDIYKNNVYEHEY